MPTYNGKDRRDVLLRQIREAIAEDNRKEIMSACGKEDRKGSEKAISLVEMPPTDIPSRAKIWCPIPVEVEIIQELSIAVDKVALSAKHRSV